MLITVKILKGGECNIEVSSSASVSVVKQLVAQQLQVPVQKQKLVFKGRTLSDSESLCHYNIVEGNKLFLFVKDVPGRNALLDYVQKLLDKHMTSADSVKVADEFEKNLKELIGNMSLDDIERLAISSLYPGKQKEPVD